MIAKSIRNNRLKVPEDIKQKIYDWEKEYVICDWKECKDFIKKDNIIRKCSAGHIVCFYISLFYFYFFFIIFI
jgi:hypothetical protein